MQKGNKRVRVRWDQDWLDSVSRWPGNFPRAFEDQLAVCLRLCEVLEEWKLYTLKKKRKAMRKPTGYGPLDVGHGSIVTHALWVFGNETVTEDFLTCDNILIETVVNDRTSGECNASSRADKKEW